MQNKSYKAKGFVKNPYDVFTLTQSGHRKNNHDLLSGGLLGMVQAIKMGMPPSHGFMSVVSHYATDSLSNRMVQTMGVEGRNIFEALMGMSSKRNQRSYSRHNW